MRFEVANAVDLVFRNAGIHCESDIEAREELLGISSSYQQTSQSGHVPTTNFRVRGDGPEFGQNFHAIHLAEDPRRDFTITLDNGIKD